MYCPRCGTDLVLPLELQAAELERIAAVGRQRPVLAIRMLRDRTELSLLQAKAYVKHLAREGGICHRCNHTFEERGPLYCPKRNALNIVIAQEAEA